MFFSGFDRIFNRPQKLGLVAENFALPNMMGCFAIPAMIAKNASLA